MHLLSLYFFFFFFLWYLGLNSGPQTCLAGALPFELLLQPIFVLGIFKTEFHQLCS
jgi:hypothetical protein